MRKRLVKLVILSLVVSGVMIQPMVVSANEDSGDEMQETGIEAVDGTAEEVGGEAVDETDDEVVDEAVDEAGEVNDVPKTGKWIKSGTRWWYLLSDNTYPSSEIMEIDGVLYAFDAQGWMVTGWYKDGGNWYYFNKSGAMKTGWVKDKGIWYYLNPSDGVMFANTMEMINDEVYVFNKSGAMLTGWYKDGGNWYYFNKSGAMKTGWIKDKGIWYYLNPSDGIMLADTMEVINNKTYMFNKSGAMKTGWQKTDNCWYYFDASGAMKTGWVFLDSKWYYLDPKTGIMSSNTLQEIGGKTYCFKSSGEMVTGVYARRVNVSDPDTGIVHAVTRNYYFEKSGAMRTGWIEINNDWSYFDPKTGIRCEGDVYSIDGTNYAFDNNGIMVTGWYNRTKAVADPDTGRVYYVTDKYYFNAQGAPQSGWVTEGKDTYWINKDGWAVSNGKYPVDKGRTGYFDENAKFVKFV